MRRKITAALLAGLLALSGVALAGCSLLQDALGASSGADIRDADSGVATASGTVDAFSINVGDCFNDSEGSTMAEGTELVEVPIVPCSDPHDNEVYFEFDLADGDYPGEEAVLAQADERCYTEFEGFVGIAWDDSVYQYGFSYPSADTWNSLSDRTVQCMIYEDGVKLTGSAADTAR